MSGLVVLLLVVVSLLAVGCGDQQEDEGTQGSGGGNATTGEEAQSSTPPEDELLRNTYEVARHVCSEEGVEAVARELGSKPTPEDAADAYAEGSTGAHVGAAKDGCLAGFAQRD